MPRTGVVKVIKMTATVVGYLLKGADGALYLYEGELDFRVGDRMEISEFGVGRRVSEVKVISRDDKAKAGK